MRHGWGGPRWVAGGGEGSSGEMSSIRSGKGVFYNDQYIMSSVF